LHHNRVSVFPRQSVRDFCTLTYHHHQTIVEKYGTKTRSSCTSKQEVFLSQKQLLPPTFCGTLVGPQVQLLNLHHALF
jgi:hypothetical protein